MTSRPSFSSLICSCLVSLMAPALTAAKLTALGGVGSVTLILSFIVKRRYRSSLWTTTEMSQMSIKPIDNKHNGQDLTVLDDEKRFTIQLRKCCGEENRPTVFAPEA